MKKIIYCLFIIFISAICFSIISIKMLFPEKNNEFTQMISSTEKKHISYAKYTNEIVNTNILKKPAYLAVIENSREARPQSGLSSADIVFETLAEGGIPRFIALFQSKTPTEMGPIRSFRKIFSDIDQLTNLPVAHCGASDEAKKLINNYNLMSMNEFSNENSYYRISNRKSPHNLYTNPKLIVSLINEKGYNYNQPFGLNFNNLYWNSDDLKTCNSININFSTYYDTSYKFNDDSYTKFMDNDVAIDKNTNSDLSFNNIFIQKTNTSLQSDGLLLDIDFYGSGNGLIISNGKYINVTWSLDKFSKNLSLKDSDGNTVPFSTGNTIWEIIDNSCNITIK